MAPTTLIQEALSLPAAERAQLAEALLRSLEEASAFRDPVGSGGGDSAPPTAFKLRVNDLGQLLPLTPEEKRNQSEAIERMLEEMKHTVDEDPPGSDEAIMRAIDERRPHRPLFEGMY